MAKKKAKRRTAVRKKRPAKKKSSLKRKSRRTLTKSKSKKKLTKSKRQSRKPKRSHKKQRARRKVKRSHKRVRRTHKKPKLGKKRAVKVTREQAKIVALLFKHLTACEKRLRKLLVSELDFTQALAAQLPVRLLTNPNTDGSVDGEFRVTSIPQRSTVQSLLMVLSSTFTSLAKTFIQVGLVVQSEEGIKSSDERYRGLNQYYTFYYRYTRSKIVAMFLAANIINANLRRVRRPKPSQIWIRLHYSPTGKAPKRGQPKERKRRA